MRLAITAAVVVLMSTSLAHSQPKKLPRIAVGAVGELSTDATSKRRNKTNNTNNTALVASLERDIVSLGLGEVINTKQLERAVKRAKKPQLLACEGDRACLAELGRTAGADWVIGVEVGGLGDVQILHLKVIVAKTAKALRSTTSNIESGKTDEGKLVELLAPKRHVGHLTIKSTVDDAEIIVDAAVVGRTPTAKIPLRVGTRALRVTHPNHRDHVRFIDIKYGQDTVVDAALTPLDVSRQKLERSGGATGRGTKDSGSTDRPWYGRWYVIAGVGAVVLTGSIIVWSATGGLDSDRDVDLPATIRF